MGIVSDFHRMIVFDETNINAMSGVMRNEYAFVLSLILGVLGKPQPVSGPKNDSANRKGLRRVSCKIGTS